MKKVVLALIICLLCVAPMVAAESLASMMNSYGKAKADFTEVKTELEECQAADEDCTDLEDEIITPAVEYASTGIQLMLAYMAYAGVEDGKTELETALDDLQNVQTKEDFDEVIASVKTVWTSAEGNVKGKAVSDLKEEVKELVDKGKLIDAKLKCGIDELSTSSSEINNNYNLFSTEITEAESKIKQAENLLASNNLASAMVAIKEAQKSLQDSKTSLSTATSALKNKGGALCTEVVVEEPETTEEEPEETTPEEEPETTEEETTADLDTLLSDYDLDSYYSDAEDAINELQDYMNEKEDDGYDVSKAEPMLTEAQNYLKSAETLVLTKQGQGALSKMLNAQQVAQRGLNSEYYELTSSSSSSSDSADFNAFVNCMESAGYSYQRENCYDDYSVSSSTQEDIETCLDSAATNGEKQECYADAEDEVEKKIVADAEELNDRLDAVDQQLEDIEDAVTDLYDELSASGESSSSNDYIDVDKMIDSLLSDVQSAREDYDQSMEDIQSNIDDNKLDDADDALDSLEDDVDNFEDDINSEIEDIQQEIDAL